MKKDALIMVRGGGDLATGTIHRLWSAGLRVLVLETEHPAAIRRQVSLCEAVYEGETTVEGLRAVRIRNTGTGADCLGTECASLSSSTPGESVAHSKPDVVVDAILAKNNLGTSRGYGTADHCPWPRLYSRAGCGCRGGDQTRPPAWTDHPGGRAIPNTGIPGVIGGYGAERVIHAQAGGVFMNVRKIGDLVEEGRTIAIRTPEGKIPGHCTQISGILRGAAQWLSGYAGL